MSLTYSPALYRDPNTGRLRWAVLDRGSHCWYFARRRGRPAARALARRLNRSAS